MAVDFRARARRIFALYREGQYGPALDLARSTASDFPDRADESSFWIACLHSRLGDAESALRTLEEALARGLWWGPDLMRLDDDLAPLRAEPRFLEIVAECERRHSSAETSGPRDPVVRLPDGRPEGVLVALHGRNSNADDFVDRWSPLRHHVIVAPRSTQRFGMRTFAWDDPGRTQDDVMHAHARASQQLRLAGLPLVTAGFSQGGAVAIGLALLGKLPETIGFIAVAPSPDFARSLVEQGTRDGGDGSRGYVVTGEHDPRREMTEALVAQLVASGVDVTLEVIKGLDHEFPPDFSERLPEVMTWVSDRHRPRPTA